jgi:hypothetical protein
MTRQHADKEVKRKNRATSLLIMKPQREDVHDDAAVVSALLAGMVTHCEHMLGEAVEHRGLAVSAGNL